MNGDSNPLDPLTAEILTEFRKRSPAVQSVFLDLVRKASEIPETPDGEALFETLRAEARAKMEALS